DPAAPDMAPPPPIGGCAPRSPESLTHVRPSSAHGPAPLLPGADPDAAPLLGRLWLRRAAALRHGGRRRDVPSGDDAARAGTETVERRLCPAVAAAEGRALWREPQPAAALLPVPGDPEAEPVQPPGTLSRLAGGDRHRPAAPRHPLRRGRLGEPDARRL